MKSRIDSEVTILGDRYATITAKIAAAARLWSLIEECQTAVEPFKAEVRDLAQKQNQPTVTLDGDGLSQCKVVFQRPSLVVKPGLTVEDERAALGDLFGVIFEVKLTLKNVDPAFIADFPKPVRDHISSVTTLVVNTPRVSLKSMPNVTDVG